MINELQSNILSYMNNTNKTAKQKEAERTRIVAKILNSNISEKYKNETFADLNTGNILIYN